MRYLFVVAHPDDEVLGTGGTICRLIREGNSVAIATLVNHVDARYNLSPTLAEDQLRAHEVLGIETRYAADFPNIKTNTVPHLELVQFVENCIMDFGAQVVVTHHPAETNIDHAMTSGAVQAAVRIFQRREGLQPLRELWYMEIPSSTEWSLDSSVRRFMPNLFMEIGNEGLETKLRALKCYKGVMRGFPHPRSEEVLRSLAAWRGSQAGCEYAEAFESVFRRI